MRQKYRKGPFKDGDQSKIDKAAHLSYFFIISKMRYFLGVTVYSRVRETQIAHTIKTYSSFTVKTDNKESNQRLIEYFDTFPLISSKYLDYVRWRELVLLQQNDSSHSTSLSLRLKTRENFNKTRTS
jgi:LAGLIDADG endonuclease